MTRPAQPAPLPLRDRIAADMRPVRPLPPPWKRALWLLPLVVLLFALPITWFGARGDLSGLGPWLTWLPVILQVSVGLALIGMALREAVPGFGVSRAAVTVFFAAALALHLGVNVAIWLRSPRSAMDFWAAWWGCVRHEALLGVPLLVVAAWLAARALPVRPRNIGLLSGAGAGVLADASWRLICPLSAPSHFVAAHLGAVVLLAAVGFGAGWLWERARVQS